MLIDRKKNKFFEKKDNAIKNIKLNHDIIYDKMIVISSQGENIGAVSKEKALLLAKEDNLDLVIVSDPKDQETLPVAKILDYSKKLYEEKKKNHKNKKSKESKNKEARFGLSISDHDLFYKLENFVSFLLSGHRVKCSIILRGRERQKRNEFAIPMMDRIISLVENLIKEKKITKNLCVEKHYAGTGAVFAFFYLKK